MKVKEIEDYLIDYVNQNYEYHHKEKALKEFDAVHEKFSLDDIQHLGVILNDYPDYDHCLFKVSSDQFFLKFGLSRSYLLSASKKDIHKIAKALHKFFGKFKLEGKD